MAGSPGSSKPAFQTMNNSTLWFILLVAAVQLASSSANPLPSDTTENAPFTVVKSAKTYEIRTYPEAKWVCKEHICPNFTLREQADSFFALHEYAMGGNAGDVKMSMTAPLSVRMSPAADTQGNFVFHMCMYIPKMNQENPPKPKETGVLIQNRPALTVAVRQFNASMLKETDWAPHIETLRTDLAAAKEEGVDPKDYYGASYDPPFKAEDRRNEVWIVKKE